MRKKNNKAISALVATVLLILITVAGVAIIWGAVMPMITRITQSGQACINARYNIDTTSGFTCAYSNGTVSISIARGAEQFEGIGAQLVILADNGNSKSITLDETSVATNNIAGLPDMNEMRTYVIGNLETGIDNPVQVSVAPIVKVGNTKTTCDVSAKVTLTECS